MTLYEYGLRSKIRQAQRFILLAKDEVEKENGVDTIKFITLETIIEENKYNLVILNRKLDFYLKHKEEL